MIQIIAYSGIIRYNRRDIRQERVRSVVSRRLSPPPLALAEKPSMLHFPGAQASPEPTLIQQEIVFVLLLLISAVAIVVRRVRLPYTVALVLAGLALAVLPTEGLVKLPEGVIALPHGNGASDEITSQLILALLVPPLVFEAAWRMNLRTLRKEWLPIFLLAVPGVLITVLLVGAAVSFALQIPIVLAMVFGAVISATDPVA